MGWTYLYCVFVFMLRLCNVLCSVEGDPCTAYNTSGTCKNIQQCVFAQNLVRDQVKPKTCAIIGMERIVCCPNENIFHLTGVFKPNFRATSDGIKISKDITCRYNGNQPLQCCENTKLVKSTAQDSDSKCYRLRRPASNAQSHVAWTKCLYYQRYLHVCVANKEGGDITYKRKNMCSIPDDVPRISGGTEAGKGQFPHMAVIGCRNSIPTDDVDIIWYGGGTLISEKFILSAAHVMNMPSHGPAVYALLGAVNKKDLHGGIVYSIIRRISNRYDVVTKKNDIALFELDREVEMSMYVRPACLPVPGLEMDNEVLVAGWGAEHAKGQSSDDLLWVNLNINEGQSCKSNYSTHWDSRTMLCATGIQNRYGANTDSCEGDSGGPLMSLIHPAVLNCTYVVRGIVSFGPGVCGMDLPAVYTNVMAYLDWITNEVWPEKTI